MYSSNTLVTWSKLREQIIDFEFELVPLCVQCAQNTLSKRDFLRQIFLLKSGFPMNSINIAYFLEFFSKKREEGRNQRKKSKKESKEKMGTNVSLLNGRLQFFLD